MILPLPAPAGKPFFREPIEQCRDGANYRLDSIPGRGLFMSAGWWKGRCGGGESGERERGEGCEESRLMVAFIR
jgi:hypothetical protein